MTDTNIGNQLNTLAYEARSALFRQAELAQLTYGAFDIAATNLQNLDQDQASVTYPVGWGADRQPINNTVTYQKAELLEKYQFLAFHQLAVNGLFQLVAITEALLGDVVRALVKKYPHKLGGKRTVSIQAVLDSSSIEEVHERATDALLNDLSYKSPAEFAESFQTLVSINVLECPAYHRYMEIKASRDIFVHNRGTANETYARKAGTHARVNPGMTLPADIQYFLESYEATLQLNEWLEQQLHDHWHSQAFEERRNAQLEIPLDKPSQPVVR